MSKSSCLHLILLAIATILLLLFTIVNCNNNDDNQMETILFGNKLTTKTDDLLDQDNPNNEYVKVFIRDLLNPYPDRRSSFYAMRGKRRAILP